MDISTNVAASLSPDVNNMLLVIAALLPAIVLCVYVFKKDRVEKEPMGLLIKLLVAGVVICFPTAYAEGLIGDLIDNIFVSIFGSTSIPRLAYYVYLAVTYFIGVALIEEGFKWLALVWLTKKNKEFNCFFDGLIYAIFVSLGFAAFENVLYVTQYGWVNALMRSVMSVPGHMFFAVFMGYYYSRWHVVEKAAELESDCIRRGILIGNKPPFDATEYKWYSIIVPVLFHGAYDFCCVADLWWATLGLYAILIYMYVDCFGKIKEMSRGDRENNHYAVGMLLKKYPELAAYAQQSRQNNV